MRNDFVHLHVASKYSLRYGTASPAALAVAAAEHGMPALALTDRDGLFGAYKHALACAAVGIAPILGADLPASGRTAEVQHAASAAAQCRVTVLAVGAPGWAALCRLVSAGRPVTPHDLAPGLIVLLGRASDVGQAVAARRYDQAEAALAGWAGWAGCAGWAGWVGHASAAGEVAVEISDHLRAGDTGRARRMLRFARRCGITAVLTNAVRYLDPADSALAQVIDATRRAVPLGTPGLPRHNGRAHLASPGEMVAAARRIAGPDAADLLADTAALARRCFLDPKSDLGIGIRHMPDLHAATDLQASCERALIGYRGDKNTARNRLRHELGIINATDLAPYFLTVADVVRRIRQAGIRCSIRGSGAGSLVNHLLGISAIDPLDYGLLMERFLSHTRETMPDIDLDVESARRIEAYRIILGAYGEDRCATVCMLDTYRARSAIRDVAAAFGLPRPEIDAIAKAFPQIRAAQISAALTELPELRHSNLNIRQLSGIFRLAERLDGLPRHAAMHPCGVLLSDATLRDRTPVTRSAADDLPLSQLDKDDAETAGVIKLDVLGVRMQSAMAYALTQIPDAPDLDSIPRNDEQTFALIRDAQTIGCFQIESPGQRELVTRVRPARLDDLIAEISLFRPGPVNSDMITPFLQVRHGHRAASYPHEELRGALRETGGVVIYHEQVMRIIDTMTGSGLAEADRVRRRLPDPDLAEWFREAAADRGYAQTAIDCVWEVLAAFGTFGFCKAHAAAFAIPVYQSAWLKRHHPAAFYAGVLTHDPGMYPKRVILADARRAGLRVLGPDVNISGTSWSITTAGGCPALTTSLHEVKGISAIEAERIVAGQPYRSLRDFWQRARVSRPVAERLIRTGAFDSLYLTENATRRDLLARLGVLAGASGRHGSQDELQLEFPGDGNDGGDGVAELVPAGELRDLDPAERVAAELEILGFEITEHVLDFYPELLAGLGVVRADRLHRRLPGETVLVAGVKVATQTPAVRSGQRIVFASLEDGTGLVDLAFFESVQDQCVAKLFRSWLLVVRGEVRGIADDAATVTATDCWDLTELDAVRARSGIDAVRTVLDIGRQGHRRGRPASKQHDKLVFSNGFTLSPYAETGSPGSPLKAAPRNLWRDSRNGVTQGE